MAFRFLLFMFSEKKFPQVLQAKKTPPTNVEENIYNVQNTVKASSTHA